MGNLYDTIQSLCKESGTSVSAMAQELGMPKSIFSNYKAGRTKMLSTDVLSKIATYFNVSVDYLLGNEEPNDQFLAFYGSVKEDLTEDDLDDIRVAMKAKAERNRKRKSGE